MNKKEFLEACKKQKYFGECYYAVYDNFLPYQEFGALQDYVFGPLGWHVSSKINVNDTSNKDFYFATTIFHNQEYARRQWNPNENVDPFLKITSKLYIDALMRIKANLYIGSTENKIHAPHIDYDLHHTGALFFVTDCDAPTYLADGTEIESKANRVLISNPAIPHSSSAPTNVPYRVTININYFGLGVNRDYIADHHNSIPTLKSDNYPF